MSLEQELGLQLHQGNDSIRTIPIRYNSHVFFLDEDIDEPSKYRDITQLLITCSADDVVSIIINSSGGRLDSACQLMEAIDGCAGQVVATVVGAAYSAASMIACVVPECQVTDSAEFMLHTASYGNIGSVPNVKAHTDFTTAQTNKLLDKVYKDFLTPEELTELKSGKEFWFSAEEARRRFKRRDHMRDEALKKELSKKPRSSKKSKLVKEAPTD
jgi:ATP-dependent protease ClpP protease subunit